MRPWSRIPTSSSFPILPTSSSSSSSASSSIGFPLFALRALLVTVDLSPPGPAAATTTVTPTIVILHSSSIAATSTHVATAVTLTPPIASVVPSTVVVMAITFPLLLRIPAPTVFSVFVWHGSATYKCSRFSPVSFLSSYLGYFREPQKINGTHGNYIHKSRVTSLTWQVCYIYASVNLAQAGFRLQCSQ